MDVIDHVAVPVADINAAVQWYLEQFECRLSWLDESWAFIEFDNCNLALVRPGDHPPHFAVIRVDVSDYGNPTEHRDGTRSVYISDRLGNYVELLERPQKDTDPMPMLEPVTLSALNPDPGASHIPSRQALDLDGSSS